MKNAARDSPTRRISPTPSRLSSAQGPRVAAGRVPLTLHLLAPNQRAVQITQDLARFWTEHYPRVKQELQRKYPKHEWR